MKKKLIAAAVVLAAAVSLGGCRAGSTEIPQEVAEANPWTEYASLEEAEEAVGFEIKTPDMSAFGKEAYSVFAGLNELQIQYGDQAAYIRKAADDGDISGDYEEYPYTEELTVGENQVTVKGQDKDNIRLAVWTGGKYSYAVGITEGIPEDGMLELVKGVE